MYQEAFGCQQASYFEILSFKLTVMQLLLLSKILWQAPLSLSNEHRRQQRVFGGGEMSSRKSVVRTNCSWQGRKRTSTHWSDPTYSLMYHFATLRSNTVHVLSLGTSQPHQKLEEVLGTDTMLQIYFACDTAESSVLKWQVRCNYLKRI